MPPGGDPAFLIFGSFDQAKERTRKTSWHASTQTFRVFALLTFFLLDQKEPKSQERLIARPRTRSAPRTWAMILLVALAILIERIEKSSSNKTNTSFINLKLLC